MDCGSDAKVISYIDCMMQNMMHAAFPNDYASSATVIKILTVVLHIHSQSTFQTTRLIALSNETIVLWCPGRDKICTIAVSILRLERKEAKHGDE